MPYACQHGSLLIARGTRPACSAKTQCVS
jgi:hypothetical protein